jgi:hypothetical protein
MDKNVSNKNIYERLSKKYNLPIPIIQRIIRLGIASKRRAMATNKRIQMAFGHFVFFDHPKYSSYIKNKSRKKNNGRNDDERDTENSAETDNPDGLVKS